MKSEGMCNRVRLLTNNVIDTVDVVIEGFIATIHMPDSINAANLRKEIENSVDHEQIECATKLWADDTFLRYFDVSEQGLSISCFRQE